MSDCKLKNLLAINRNQNGDYYFIFSVENVKNFINTKAKPRNEVLIVGVPKSKLVNFLTNSGVVEDFEFYIDEKENITL